MKKVKKQKNKKITIKKSDCIEMLKLGGLGDKIDVLVKAGYFKAPASRKHHLPIIGGLAVHSMNVARRLVEISEAMGVKWSRKESPYIVGLLHDLVKTRCYCLKDGGKKNEFEYVHPSYPGHGICSTMVAQELGIKLTPDEVAAIAFHMGEYGVVSGEYSQKDFDGGMLRFAPQLIATCSADWFAARVDEAGVWG